MIKLKEIRSKIGFSQIEVAKRLSLPISTYNQYETGKNEPNLETLCNLADFFHCSLDELVGRETDIVNLNALNETEQYLIRKIIKMNNFEQAKTKAYVMGLTE